MKLNVPYDWDLELLEKLEPYKDDISSFYASLPESIIGSIRHPDSLPKISKDEVAKHVSAIHDFGAEFLYLANSLCMGNREFEKKEELLKYFKWIESTGADAVVLANPFLIDFVREHFPEMRIHLSLIAETTSLQKARFNFDIGIEKITLPDSMNYNLDFIKEVSKLGQIEVLINNLCLLDCPIKNYHVCFCSHNSQPDNARTDRYDEYPIMWCSERRMKNPVEMIKSPWVRPEDLKFYEDAGVGTFKISGREKGTDWIVERVKIYASRKHEGNVLDYLNTIIYGYPKLCPEVKIDNKSMDGFIEEVFEKGCDQRCESCGICQRYAGNSLKIDGDMERFFSFLGKVKSKMIQLDKD